MASADGGPAGSGSSGRSAEATHSTHEAFKIPSHRDRKAASSLYGLNAVGVRYALRREQNVASAESVLLVLDPQAQWPYSLTS
jgi:hypothetical protein